MQFSQEALEVARRVGDKFAEANARINLFTAAAAEGVPPRVDDVLEIIGLAAEASDYEDAYRALVNVIWTGPGYLPRAAIDESSRPRTSATRSSSGRARSGCTWTSPSWRC